MHQLRECLQDGGSVSMHAPGMSGKDVELMGVAAAASHLRDIQCASSDSEMSRICAWSRNSDEVIDKAFQLSQRSLHCLQVTTIQNN